jgi:hypothetical protein
MKYVKLFESWLNEADEEKKDIGAIVGDSDSIGIDAISKMTIGDFKKLDSLNKGRVIEILQKSLFPGLDSKYFSLPKFDSKNENDYVIFKGTDARPESIVIKLDKQEDNDSILNLKLKPSSQSVFRTKIDYYTIGEMAELFNKMVKTSDNPYTADEFFDKNTQNKSKDNRDTKTIWSLLDAEGGKKMSNTFKTDAIEKLASYLKKDNQGQKFFAQIKNTIDANFAPKKLKPAPKQNP